MKTVKLGEVAEIERAVVEAAKIQSGTMYVGLENIESSGAFVGQRPVEAGELASAKFRFTDAHVLYGKLRPYLSKIACPDFGGVCSTDILPILPGKSLNRRYLHHWLRTPHMVEKATSLCAGANLPRLSPKLLAQFEIPLPALAEQKRIAAILDAADALRAQRRRALARLDDLARSLFLHHFGDPVSNPKGWPVVKVGVAGKVQLGRQRAPKYQTGAHTRPYMRVANVYENRIDTSDVLSMDFATADFRDYKLEHGDILLNEGQSIELVGRPAMWRNEIQNCCFQNTLVRFQADLNRVEPTYALGLFLRYFNAGEFSKIGSKTSNVAHLGAARFANMKFPLPPLALQQRFARELAAVEAQKARQRAHLTQLDALFASLQSRAFTGGL